MKQTIYFKEEENKLDYHMNQEEVKEINLEEEQIVEVIKERLNETESLQIIIEENSSNIIWEELKSVDGFPFSCNSHTALAHSVKTKNNKTAIPRRKLVGALKVLVVGCTPTNLPKLDIQAEFTKINSALRDLEQRGIVELKMREVTDLNSLATLIQSEKPDIFHFVGHTVKNTEGEYELALASRSTGITKGVTLEQLSSLLLNHNVQFTFINACDSSNIAQNLAKEGLASIGMRKEIRDNSSKTFSETLYNSLVNGETLDTAINNARHSLYLNNKENKDWSYPVLYVSNHELLGFKIEPIFVPMSEVAIECNNTKHVNVFIDDKLIGITPLTIKVRIDSPIEIRMGKEGYKSLSKKFRATNPKEFFTENLDPILGTLVVETDPKIANIAVKCQRIDNPKECREITTNAMGEATFNELPIGEYEIYTSYELKGNKVNIEEKSQSEPLKIEFPIEMHLSHGMATVGTLILKWLRKPTTIVIGLLFLLLTVGTFLFINQPKKKEDTPKGMVEIKGIKKYTFLGMDISEKNTPQLKGESDYEYKERLKLSQLMVDEIRSAESATQVQRYWGDKPRTYKLENDFYIDKTEVTVGQYAKFLDALKANSSLLVQYQHLLDLSETKEQNKKNYKNFIPEDWNTQMECLDCPVVNVDYFMAWAYAKFVGKRIPTNIEWEIAARGKEGRIFPWGNQYEPWRYNGYVSPYTSPIPVASSKYKKGWTPNSIADMAGNIQEWVLLKSNNSTIKVGTKGGTLNSRGIMFILNYGTYNIDKPSMTGATTGFRCISDSNRSNMVLIEHGKYPIGGIHNYYFDIIRNDQIQRGNDKQRLLGERPLTIPIKNTIEEIQYLKDGLKTFYIDTHEITVGEYSIFIDDLQRKNNFRQYINQLLGVGNFIEKPKNWNTQILDRSKPVRGISYYMAKGYCLSKSKRLPTIFEYEYLIGGNQGNMYAHPNLEDINTFNNNFLFQSENSQKYRMNLADVSDGKIANALDKTYLQNNEIYHLIGNVAEWSEDPRYMTGDYAYVKGGDFRTHGILGTNRFYKLKINKQTLDDDDIGQVGFRCAKDK